MIDSQRDGMPYSDTSGSPAERRSMQGAKRPNIESEVPHCKKRKKSHKKIRLLFNAKSKLRSKLKKRIRTKPEAPFNSTQFIMNEHDIFSESDLAKLRPRRQRDSSLSMESEDPEDELCSSPEEEQFITQQFWSAYEDFHAERLDSMPKSQLVQEYFTLEEKLIRLERELAVAQSEDRRMIRDPSPPIDDDDEDEEEESPMGEIRVDAETAAKIEVFRNEIEKLESENLKLKAEVTRRRKSCRRCLALSTSTGSPVRSRSSASSSSTSSSSDSSDESSSDSDDSEDSISSRQKICNTDSVNSLPPRLSENSPPREDALIPYTHSEGSSNMDKGEYDQTKVEDFHHLVSDSGIASSSSGDDFKSDPSRKMRIRTSIVPPEVLQEEIMAENASGVIT